VSQGVDILQSVKPVLDIAFDVHADPEEFIRAAMDWQFCPPTGSPLWLKRAESLEFDPRSDVRSFGDLRLFPNVTNKLRDVRAHAQDLIHQGFGPDPDVVGVFETRGTTGAAKRVVVLGEWWDRMLAWYVAHLEARGVPRSRNLAGPDPERAAHSRCDDERTGGHAGRPVFHRRHGPALGVLRADRALPGDRGAQHRSVDFFQSDLRRHGLVSLRTRWHS
jgi:hypothetical protein